MKCRSGPVKSERRKTLLPARFRPLLATTAPQNDKIAGGGGLYQEFEKRAGLLPTNAAMPSFWSLVAKTA